MNHFVFSQGLRSYLKEKPIIEKNLLPVVRYLRNQVRLARYQVSTKIKGLRYSTISRKEFLNDIKSAIQNNTGFAAAKTGGSQQHWMYYPILLGKKPSTDRIIQFEQDLVRHSRHREGIFPGTPSWILRFNEFYIPHLKNLNCWGIFYLDWELEIIKYYGLRNKLIFYVNQEPDRSSPSRETNCYLPYFRNKKLLIVAPFAHLLKQRATKKIFEGVWSKTGKTWFYPDSVDSIEFPYGFVRETHKTYPTVLDLFIHITAEIDRREFDVALIAAGALSIPLASHIKNMGKVGIDLGGHLQVLFGVLGKRWRHREEWKRLYINDWWIDMPVKYKPADEHDSGAFW